MSTFVCAGAAAPPRPAPPPTPPLPPRPPPTATPPLTFRYQNILSSRRERVGITVSGLSGICATDMGN
jgi:hypothetical protein